MNETKSINDYVEFMSQFAPALGRIAGLTPPAGEGVDKSLIYASIVIN